MLSHTAANNVPEEPVCCLHVLRRETQDVSLKLYSLTIQYDIAKDETLAPQAASDKTHLGH